MELRGPFLFMAPASCPSSHICLKERVWGFMATRFRAIGFRATGFSLGGKGDAFLRTSP